MNFIRRQCVIRAVFLMFDAAIAVGAPIGSDFGFEAMESGPAETKFESLSPDLEARMLSDEFDARISLRLSHIGATKEIISFASGDKHMAMPAADMEGVEPIVRCPSRQVNFEALLDAAVASRIDDADGLGLGISSGPGRIGYARYGNIVFVNHEIVVRHDGRAKTTTAAVVATSGDSFGKATRAQALAW